MVQNLTLQDNIGSPDGLFGDGVTIRDSTGNRVQGNTIRRNGPFSGISLVGASTENEILDNIVSENNMLPGDPQDGRQDMGIRMEGPGASRNKVLGNTVTGSGAEGIVVLPTCADPEKGCAGIPGNESNELSRNMSHRNGTSGSGSGIRLFSMANPVAATNTTVSQNVTNDNTTFGIAVDAVGDATPSPANNRLTATPVEATASSTASTATPPPAAPTPGRTTTSPRRTSRACRPRPPPLLRPDSCGGM